MKVTRKFNQSRRDCSIDLICENCSHEETLAGAYDDDNYWINVVPNFKCKNCGKSTNDLGLKPEKIETKYNQSKDI